MESIPNHFSGIYGQRAAQLEADPDSGTIVIFTHERAYMLSVIRSEDGAEERKALVRTYFSLTDEPT